MLGCHKCVKSDQIIQNVFVSERKSYWTDHFKPRPKQPSGSICLAVIREGDDVCD